MKLINSLSRESHENICIFFACIFLSLLPGCALHPVKSIEHAFSSAEVQNPPQDSAPGNSVALSKPVAVSLPATINKTSAIARVVANIVHISELIGVLSLLAGGALIYFGQIIPGVKCVIGGIALPVCAVWFDYHYGIVLWLLLIGSSAGFLWAFNKYDPALLSSLLASTKNALASSEAELSALKKKL